MTREAVSALSQVPQTPEPEAETRCSVTRPLLYLSALIATLSLPLISQ
jgi:hypothetical protein